MYKKHILGILTTLITGAIVLFFLTLSDTNAACGSSSFLSFNCPAVPYCSGDSCGLNKGVDAVTTAVGGQLSSKGISEYAQIIVTYLMGFVSLIAVIYIIYAGFQLMIGAGDEEKMKKTRNIITYVVIGILIMWLAYPIVKWTINLVSPSGRVTYDWSLIESATAAYSESDIDTFADYRNRIREGLSTMDNELRVNRSVNPSTVSSLKSLIQAGYERLPDSGDIGVSNREAKQLVDSYLDLAIKNPTDSNHIGNAISRVANFLDRASISRITGDIATSASEGNAPLTVSFRGDNIRDPSGVALSDTSYIWWMKEAGGVRRELQRGPNLAYTFTREGTYTVFLDVVSGSRNSKGKIDVLPLSTSKQIAVKPKLGEVILMINGVNVSNMSTFKISPTIGNMGLIFDATASRASNGTITETVWNFGNGEESSNPGAPVIERKIYALTKGYIVTLTIKTNNGQSFTKSLQLLVADPAATIKLDQETGHIGEDISMSALSYLSDTRNVSYSWQIQDDSGKKVLKVGEGMSLRYKFDTTGTYIITLTTKGANGSSDTDSKRLMIESREPVVNIDTPRSISSEKPNTIVFDASKSYDPDTSSRGDLSYVWRIDGEVVTLNSIENGGSRGTYTFDTKGSHRVSVTVSNTQGKITTVEKDFEVTSILAVNMIVTPKVATRGTAVSLVGQSSHAEFYEWNMGDGSPSISGTSRSVQHIYKQSGVYTATLRISSSGDSESNTISRKVYISDADTPMAIIDISNSSSSVIEEKGACNGLDAYVLNRSENTTFASTNSINIDGSTSGLSYTWKYFGKARTTSQISEKFNELGCFPIELTVRSNKNGATHTTTQYIKLINAIPELTNITTTIDNNKKDSQKVLVKVKANGATDRDGVITSYIWYYRTDSDTEPQSVQITNKNEITFVLPNITEKYYFGAILEDNDGGRMDSIEAGQGSTPLMIDNSNGNINLPLITLTVPKVNINVGESARFAAEVRTIIPGQDISKKVVYAWDWDGDGRIDEQGASSSMDHVYTRSGDYNMKIRVTNNGVSNTKYQMIHVRNKLQAGAYGYRLPDGRIYMVNSSLGSYDTTSWDIDGTKYTSIASLMVESGSISSARLTVSSGDDESSTIDIDVSKFESVSGTGVLYQSYPRAIDDTIIVKNPTDVVSIALWGNSGSAYAIDTDTSIDTSLDGVADNDADNQNDASYNDGSAYILRDFSTSHEREHRVRIMVMRGEVVSESRTIKVILEYIASTSEVDISGSGSMGNMSKADIARLESLSSLIRGLTDSDRIILMQRYNTLVTNWNDTFDKATALIDIQEGIDSGKMSDDIRTKLSQVVDDIVVGDAQATNEVGIATILIKQLIPTESANHATILTKLAEIEGHPALLVENKRIGKEILLLVEKDPTIDDKYKIHIRNQLSLIISGGSASIVEEVSTSSPTTDTGVASGILGFIGGFVKVFFIIIGVILFIGIIAFVLYRVSRKDENIGFQDFLIDSVFHSRGADPVSIKNPIMQTPVPVIPVDPIASYIPPVIVASAPSLAPSVVVTHADPLSPPPVSSVAPLSIDVPLASESVTSSVIPVTESIPDWLKPASSMTIDPISIATSPIPSSVSVGSSESPVSLLEPSIDPVIESAIEQSDTISSVIPESIVDPLGDTIATLPLVSVPAPVSEELPDWLRSSIQSSETIIVDPIDTTLIDDTHITEDIGVPVSDPLVEAVSRVRAKSKKQSSKKVAQNTEEIAPILSKTPDTLPDWLK